jgi:4-diphosphocytidyl-2-C-methyl-D-erythritol kinase
MFKIKANAKVNLSLDVTGKRADGYHTLRSVMQSVSLCDVITVEESGELSIVCGKCIKSADNLALKAAEIYLNKVNSCKKYKITVEKNIPVAGGLGGGSADAAAVLIALNILHGNILTQNELCELGLTLGADVPFCIIGGTALAEGVGEILTPITNLPDCFIVIAKKGNKSSTGDMYKKLDSGERIKISDIDQIAIGLAEGSIKRVAGGLYNCFEEVAGDISEVKNILLKYGALYAGLSGAGPGVIGVFENEDNAKTAVDTLKSIGAESFLSVPTKAGTEIIE